jgi:hypothetical protein
MDEPSHMENPPCERLTRWVWSICHGFGSLLGIMVSLGVLSLCDHKKSATSLADF